MPAGVSHQRRSNVGWSTQKVTSFGDEAWWWECCCWYLVCRVEPFTATVSTGCHSGMHSGLDAQWCSGEADLIHIPNGTDIAEVGQKGIPHLCLKIVRLSSNPKFSVIALRCRYLLENWGMR